MAIKFKINISKKAMYTLIAIVVLLVLGVVAYAYNDPAVYGHSYQGIELPDSRAIWPGLNADMVDGKNANEIGGTLECNIKSGSATTVYCDAEYTMTGGGCYNSNYLSGTYPNGNGWSCIYSGTTYVRCCKVV